MNNQNVLALDLATKTGWAIRLRDGRVLHGMYNASASNSAHEGQRYVNFRRFLVDLIQEHDVHHVAYEDVRRHMSTMSAHVHGGLKAIMLMICAANNLETSYKGVGTIKKHWTSKGTASKKEMIVEAVKRGYAPQDDNVADALAILSLTLADSGVMI